MRFYLLFMYFMNFREQFIETSVSATSQCFNNSAEFHREKFSIGGNHKTVTNHKLLFSWFLIKVFFQSNNNDNQPSNLCTFLHIYLLPFTEMLNLLSQYTMICCTCHQTSLTCHSDLERFTCLTPKNL